MEAGISQAENFNSITDYWLLILNIILLSIKVEMLKK